VADADLMPDLPVTSDTGGEKGDAVSETKALVLDRLAKSEDASNYIAERADLEREEETGEVETSAVRAQRIKEALEKARRDTAEAKANGLDDQLQNAQAQWEQQQAQEQWAAQQADQLLENTRAEARFQEHASLLKQANPQLWEQITSTLGTFDTLAQSDEQIDVLKAGLTKGAAREGMAMAWRLSQPWAGA
jgi:Rad3-related DNA helicase